jgi:streptogramin lyase
MRRGVSVKRSIVRSLCASALALLTLMAAPAVSFAIDEFPLTVACPAAVPAGTGTCQPAGISAGSDGNVWFTEENGNRIGRITPGGAITEFTAGLSSGALPSEITAGPDGRLWFTESGTNKIGAINPATGQITEYGPTTAPPDGITAGPATDPQSLWFTEYSSGGTSRIGRITTAGTITDQISLPTDSGPGDIAVGPDNRVWFTQGGASASTHRIGVIDPITKGIDHYPPTGGLGDPSGITPSGTGLWFTEFGASQVRRIEVNGAIGAPTPVGSGPSAIATGADGALWFTETSVHRIGRITPTGVLTNEFATPTSPSEPGGITAGPDGALWFTEFVGNKIGRIATAPPFVPPPPPPPAAPSPSPAGSSAKKCKVPKLKGLTIRKARKKLKKAGCKYRFRGKGRVRSTVPKAGRRTTKRVTVRCKRKAAKRSARRAAEVASQTGTTAHDLTVNHLSRKPRRTNRRLRVRNVERLGSAQARNGPRAARAAEMTVKRKRHSGKRAVMRRLMTVRGGLQA